MPQVQGARRGDRLLSHAACYAPCAVVEHLFEAEQASPAAREEHKAFRR